jgi:hypothetical protein
MRPTALASRRFAAAALAILCISGVLSMNTPALAASDRQMVLDHLAAAFGVTPDDVDILSLTPRDLPAGAAEFYVEAKGSHGHDNHNCIVMGGKVYCSGADGEFARVLREQSLLGKDLGAAQLMRLYSLFALPRQVKYIDANVLARNPQAWQAYPEVAAPALSSRPDGAVTLTFYATPVTQVQPSKWMVTVSRDYRIEVGSTPLPPR